MAWTPDPATPLYANDALLVYTTFPRITFAYTDGLTPSVETFTVTSVVPSEVNSLCTVGTNYIEGQYDGAPHGGMSVYYLKKDLSYDTVTNFDDIQNSLEICSYSPPTNKYHNYSYNVTATGNLGTVVTATYTLTTTFNWDAGKLSLLQAVADTRS